jgi:peroxiredoxin
MALLLAAALLAAPSLELTDAKGAVHRLADYRGKVVLLNFWATWCEPCRAELPDLERLRVALSGKPFVILAVQTAGSARTAQDTADELHLRFPLLLDRDRAVTEAWGVDSLPTTFLIDADGAVQSKQVGERNWSDAAARREIAKLLPQEAKRSR